MRVIPEDIETEEARKKRRELFDNWRDLGQTMKKMAISVSLLGGIVQNPMAAEPDDPALHEFMTKCDDLIREVQFTADLVRALCDKSVAFVTGMERA